MISNMGTPELLHKPEALGQLFSRIEILKKRFPQIGIVCQRMPLDQKIKTFNAAEPSIMQFKPKTVDEMKKLAAELKETDGISSVHLPNLKFDKSTGKVNQKDEIIEMLGQDKPNLITTHPGWKDADLVLDEQGNWRETDLANEVVSELADLFIAGIRTGKDMTLENVRYKPHEHHFRERLGSKPEHLIAARNKIAQVVCAKTGMSLDEVLSKIGYTFDVGHAAGNAHLSSQYTIESWLKQIGPDIRIMHIHDMRPMLDGDVEIEKTHLPLGEGMIDWKSFFQLKNEYCPSAPMVLELTEAETIKSVDYLSKLE